MFGINASEFVLIAVVALVALGPERLPEVMRTMGRAYRQVRALSDELTGELQRQLEPGMEASADQAVPGTALEDAGAGIGRRSSATAQAGPWTLAGQAPAGPGAEPEPQPLLPEGPAALRRPPANDPILDGLRAGPREDT
jgi:sec-independent protein translocase protein TatB